MTPRHHLDEVTIVGYSAGALPTALAVVAAAHLGICQNCRESLRNADAIGGLLLAQQQSSTMPSTVAREAMLAQLATTQQDEPRQHHDHLRNNDPDALPSPLHPYFGSTFSALRWRMVAPGVHRIRATHVTDGNLMLLRIGPGKSVPMHSHQGNELTMILRGSYDDTLGHFSPGDVADLDCDITHQPITSPGSPCICVAATDAPLRFDGWVARMLQPLIKL
ncbi:transcriptional regulator [Dyella lipolytica]|uniref:Cupin domain-containing protein n=1 Tax=Dyella lipolytica TaxID=1867835 RepID=A0ABW8IXR7_9GAMM|nr:ChrR family anti-sigma-E factor [Dyella lipolytica]GLQ45966.1 transcriptional regulator [Dyella lipolytica]